MLVNSLPIHSGSLRRTASSPPAVCAPSIATPPETHFVSLPAKVNAEFSDFAGPFTSLLASIAQSYLPDLTSAQGRCLGDCPHGRAVGNFIRQIESLNARRPGAARLAQRQRIVREVLQGMVDSPQFRQQVQDELVAREPGCSDELETTLDELERLRRLGRVESTEQAALTALRQVYLNEARYRACASGSHESLTSYAMLAAVFDAEMHRVYGGNGGQGSAVAPQLQGYSDWDATEAKAFARSFLADEQAGGYARTRQEAAGWPAWMRHAGHLPEVAERTLACESRAASAREAVAGNEDAEHAVVIRKDVEVSEAMTAPIAQALERMARRRR